MATFQTITTPDIRPVTTLGNFTLTAPTGGTAGDLYVACIVWRGSIDSGGPPSLATGWNLIQRHNNTTAVSSTQTNTNAVGAAMMAWIVRGATEPSLVFGNTATQQFPNIAIGTIIRISGADTTNPVDASSVNTLASGGTAATTTAITTSSANDLLILGCFGGQEGATLTDQWSAQQVGGVNMTERNDQGTTSGFDCSLSVATLTKTNTGTTGGGTATCTASARHTLILAAIRPAQVAGNNARSFSVLI